MNLRRALLAALAVVTGAVAAPVAGPSAQAAPPGDDEVIAFEVVGAGNGHGRGLSQWGAYGRALAGQSWQQILDAYYGGTTLGDASAATMTVDLTAWRDASSVGVVSPAGTARWQPLGPTYRSIYAVETAPNRFDVYAASDQAACGSGALVATNAPGPIVFTAAVDETTAAPSDVLGLCSVTGVVTQYRGALRFVDAGGPNRVVNALSVESYLRGVVPREVPASWGGSGGGAGMNALRAQAVAARSYALAQDRYPGYGAKTCDTSSCQVYGGAAGEHPLTDQAVAETAGKVRLAANGSVATTEFSASNGPRTAYGVDDPWDDQPGNPNHRWTRIVDADALDARYSLRSANGVATRTSASAPYDGIWDNEVVLGDGRVVSAWDFRNAFGLPSPGFELVPIRRTMSSPQRLALIGDSVGASVTVASSELPVLLDGVFASIAYDAVSSRRTQGGTVQPDGVGAAANVPDGTDLVVVELGYNDDPAAMPARIDAVMAALRQRHVGRVMWVNTSERRPEFHATNVALAAAATRWGELSVLDWQAASSPAVPNADRWFSDRVHLTTTGRAEFSLWLREQLLARPLLPGVPLRVPMTADAGFRADGAAGAALNVTSVFPAGPGYLRVWPCGSPEPDTSSVNFVSAGTVEPNAVIAAVDATREVCVSTTVATHVIVDVTAALDGAVSPANGRLVDTREGLGRVVPGAPLRVPVAGRAGVAPDAAAVALNVTSVFPAGPGFLRVWPCGSPEPETSSVNFVSAGTVEPNAVVVPIDGTGDVCVSTITPTDVIVDVTAAFTGGVRGGVDARLVDTRYGIGPAPR